MSSIVPRLAAHLREAPPIELEYTIGTEGESPSHPDCYEMDVEVPATHPPQLVEFLQKHSKVSHCQNGVNASAATIPSTP